MQPQQCSVSYCQKFSLFSGEKKGGKIWEQESELIDVKLVNACEIGKDRFFPQLNFVNVNEGDIKYRYSL